MSTENTSGSPLSRVERILEELKHALKEALEGPHQCATKHDLHQVESRIMLTVNDAIAALTALSTASDGLSVKVDKLIDDVTKLITVLQAGGNLTPDQEAAVAQAQTSAAAAAAEGDKVDASVAAADKVLPTPAPAGAK